MDSVQRSVPVIVYGCWDAILSDEGSAYEALNLEVVVRCASEFLS
jgi:hypothetical protein